MALLRLSSILAAAIFFGAAADGAAAAPAPVKVVATFSVLGDLVKNVGGDHVALTTLVGPNGDAHVYEPAAGDAKALAQADLVVVNGLGMEGWMDRLVAAAGYRGKVAVASDGVAPRTMREGGVATIDPHAWQDLRNGVLYVRNIAAALSDVDPAHEADYRANADAYGKAISDLDAEIRAELADVPAAKRKIITSHDAFGYFGAAYDIEILAPVGINTESEASASDVAALVRQIRKQHVRALFLENMSDPRLVEQLGREAKATVGGTLYSDALSEPGGPADSYLKMFRHNLPLLKAAMMKNDPAS